jgi:hypothetical protein
VPFLEEIRFLTQGLMIKFFSFHKKSNSHKLESFFFWGVQEPKILILDPGLYCRGLRYIAHAFAQEIIYAKILRVVTRRKIFKT